RHTRSKRDWSSDVCSSDLQERAREKQRLCEIIKMLIGLRKAWQTWKAHDDTVPYRADASVDAPGSLFHHETLEVYGAALELMARSEERRVGKECRCRLWCE